MSLIILLLFNIAVSSDNFLINEEFNNANHKWENSFVEFSELKVNNGILNIQIVEESEWENILIEVYLHPIKDLEIESKIKFNSGDKEGDYGIAYASHNYQYANYFVISNNGEYKVYADYNSESIEYTDWVESEFISSTDFNTLKIIKNGNKYSYYINNNKVFESDKPKFYGIQNGFTLQSNMSVDVDYFRIIQEATEINLHKDINYKINREYLSKNINSEISENAPYISPDGNILFFDREIIDKDGNDLGTDIFYSEKDAQGNFTLAKSIGKPLNNEDNNSAISITSDGNSLMVLNVYNPDGSTERSGISISKKVNNKWQVPIEIKVEDAHNNSEFSEYMLSADGTTLISTIERNETFGMKDIYVSFKKEDGSFSKPKNLGPVVNSFSQETGAFLASDKTTLYYSTFGYKGYGYNDLFMTKRLDDTWTNWSTPVNLGNKINSDDWDAYLSLDASGEFAYMTSVKEENNQDILKVDLPPSVRPDPVCLVKGTIRDSKTKEILSTIVEYKDLNTNEIMGTASSDDISGVFKIILIRGKKYSFNAKKEGYYPISQNLDLSEINKYQEVEVDLYLIPIEKGAEIILNNVFFEYNKADLQSDSYSELNNLVEFLKFNKDIKIEISGHTDDQGSADYNLKLSESRATSVMNYITNKGISKERLSAVGYGKTKPIVSNDSDENRAKNRRVEFKIQ